MDVSTVGEEVDAAKLSATDKRRINEQTQALFTKQMKDSLADGGGFRKSMFARIKHI